MQIDFFSNNKASNFEQSRISASASFRVWQFHAKIPTKQTLMYILHN